MVKNCLIIALISLVYIPELNAQKTFTASFFNNAVSLPGGSFSSPLHPGFDLGVVLPLYKGKRWERSIIPRLGYFHQRLVHHGIQIYGEYTWRYFMVQGIALEGALGVGYLHTLEQHDIFTLQADGTYKRTGRWGKPHIQASAALGFSFAPPEWSVRPFLSYRFRVIAPFVREYVPILPATSLHLGLYVTLFHPTKSS